MTEPTEGSNSQPSAGEAALVEAQLNVKLAEARASLVEADARERSATVATLTEAQLKLKLAEALASHAEAEARQRSAAAPWWRNGRTITTLVALAASVAPVTTYLKERQQLRIQESAERQELVVQRAAQAQELRDRYLSTVLTNPKSAEVVLRFVQDTSDDEKMLKWVKREQEALAKSVSLVDKCFDEAYPSAIQAATKLVSNHLDKAARETFDKLYSDELLPCETPDMESAMVRFKQELEKCPNCPDLENRKYALARQAKVDRYEWETGSRSGPDDKAKHSKPSAARVQERPRASAATEYQSAAVSCDRASHRTTESLSKANQAVADERCRAVSSVDHKGLVPPYVWPGNDGLTFNTGERISGTELWCSCAFAR